MDANAFFRTFLQGTEEIIQSDKACADILHWANDKAMAESADSTLECVAAFLLLGLKSEIDRMVSNRRATQSRYYDGWGGISDDEWEMIDEKNELWNLEEVISKLLSEIVVRVTGSDEKYTAIIQQHKKMSYDGARLRLETVRKMQRYLDATILFLKSLDEANLSPEEKAKYTSQVLEMRKSTEAQPATPDTGGNKAHSTDMYIIGMLKEAGIIEFDGHIPLIGEKGIAFLRLLCQEQVENEFSDFSGNQLQVTDAEAINIFKDMKIIEADGQTLSDRGLNFFKEMARDTFSSGSPLGTAKMDLGGRKVYSTEEAEQLIKELEEKATDTFKERVIAGMLQSARKIENIDSIVLGWILNRGGGI